MESEDKFGRAEDTKLICTQEGHTGVIELKPVTNDNDEIAADDPEAVRLMIDYFYLSDYDPDLVTKDSSTGAADGSDVDVCSKGGVQQEDMGCYAGPEIQAKQRDEIGPEPDPLDADPAVNQAGDPSFPTRRKKKKGKSKQLVDGCLLPSQLRALEPTSLPVASLLTIHARMYSIAAKYGIRPLMETAVMKFRSMASSRWDVKDLIAAIPIVYKQISECEQEIREILEAMILENAHRLVSEPGFSEAIEHVDGLTLNLFRRLGALTRYQKICWRCDTAYVSRCALDGCRPAPFGHDCDLSGPCRHCGRNERLSKAWC